jgi:hypothetical protein
MYIDAIEKDVIEDSVLLIDLIEDCGVCRKPRRQHSLLETEGTRFPKTCTPS